MFQQPTARGWVIGLTAALMPSVALATNGYFSHGYGTRAKSMAGVAVAVPQDAMVAAVNPAGMYRVGNRFDLGVAIFAPDRGFTANRLPGGGERIPPGEYDSSNDVFLIPHFGYNRMLDDKSSVGISIGGNGGLNTEYETDVFREFSRPGFTASQSTGLDLIQLFVGATYAREVLPGHSFGVTPIFAMQRLKAEGLQPFAAFSRTRGDVTNRGHDYSYGGGVRVGWLGDITDWLSLGVSYQSRIYMTSFDKYSGLLAEGGDLDIPPVFNVGFALKPLPKWTLGFEYQRISFEDVDAIGNPSDLSFADPDTNLGGDDGLGFGWKDADIFKVGLRWGFRPDLTFRAGYSHTNQVIEGGQALFNVLAPAVVQDHLTFGFSKSIGETDEISLSYMHALNEKVSGTNPNTGPQTGFIEMSQNEVELSWSRRW